MRTVKWTVCGLGIFENDDSRCDSRLLVKSRPWEVEVTHVGVSEGEEGILCNL